MSKTIYDVAKLAGVSISTVSRVLNKGNVKKDTEIRVLNAIKLLDFYPSMSARGLAKKETKVLGVYLSSNKNTFLSDSYTLEFIKGFFDAIKGKKYSLLLISSEQNERMKIPEYVSILKEKGIDGLVMMDKDINDIYLQRLIENDYPIVYSGKRIVEGKGLNVYAHLQEYFRTILSTFYEHGHRDIILVNSSVEFVETSMLRTMIFQDFCNEHGIPYSRRNIFYIDETKSEPYNDIINLVKNRKCTALFADCKKAAQDVVNVMHNAGLNIPKDVSIVCVEHKENEAATLYPPISSIYVPSMEMGKASAELLLDVIKNRNTPSREILVDPIYIDRGSIIKI